MAVLLSCLQALPLHESTHNVPVGLGPPWMSKAKDLFLTCLPVSSTIVRRAAAEGLSLLATLGVTEDAHFLQSTVLHSLDEVMRSFKPESKPKATGIEFISAARAGSLLTLACIQRTSCKVKQKKLVRARNRSSENYTEKADKENESLPVLQMMTRILPSVSCFGFRDYFVVKTYALHSFAVLLAYSNRLGVKPMSAEDKQLLLKGIELVEDNFIASWTAASVDVDKGQEADKLTAEIAFLAVLLRLMTFLTPYLREVQKEDPDVTRRFCIMLAIIQETHGSHPSITVEAMAFAEVLAANHDLLPAPVSHIDISERPMFSIIPLVIASLTPVRPSIFADSSTNQTKIVSPSLKSLRSTVYFVQVLSRVVPVEEWNVINCTALVIALLEATSCSRYFHGSRLFRSLSTSRVADALFSDATLLELEIFEAVPTLMFIDRSLYPDDQDRCLRWILFGRQLLAGSMKSRDVNATDYTLSGVISWALKQSYDDTMPVFDVVNPLRSNVKCLAAQILAVALNLITPTSMICIDNVHFDISVGNRVATKHCNDAAKRKGMIPSSYLVFHLEDVLTAVCASCVASIDQSEVRIVQEPSMYVLVKLIQCFGPLSDKEDPNLSTLDQYSTQIFASIKHAIVAPDEGCDILSSRLFLAGCKALQVCVETKLATDPPVLKRLLRPAVPAANEVPFVKFGTSTPELSNPKHRDTYLSNITADKFVKCCKIWTIVKTIIGSDPSGSRPEYLTAVSNDLIPEATGVAVHSLITAFDGIRLLYASSLTLAGIPFDGSDDEQRKTISLYGGVVFENLSDVDDHVKELLASTWSSCVSCALHPLLRSESMDNDHRLECSIWVKSLIPVLFSGVSDGIQALGNGAVLSNVGPSWSMSINPTDVVVDCMKGLSLVVNYGDATLLGIDNVPQIAELFGRLLHDIIVPALEGQLWTESRSDTMASSIDRASIIGEVCSLLVNFSTSNVDIIRDEAALLVCMLTPLNMLQNEKVDFTKAFVGDIIAACLCGMSELIRVGATISNSCAHDQLVRSMLHLILHSDIVRFRNKVPATVLTASQKLLQVCLEGDSLTSKEKIRIAVDLAQAKSWELWFVVASIRDSMYIQNSFPMLHEVLKDPSDSENHLLIVKTILELLQKSPGSTPLIGKILNGLGAELLSLIYLHGTCKISKNTNLQQRVMVCSTTMKIILAAYQQMVTDDVLSADMALQEYILVVFHTLLPILRFNGLPNHPASLNNVGSDPALGRMCAQSILLTARTTPTQFKECVSMLSDFDRTLLEFAVRAEMSGYAVVQEAPAKKKLNLANFKK